MENLRMLVDSHFWLAEELYRIPCLKKRYFQHCLERRMKKRNCGNVIYREEFKDQHRHQLNLENIIGFV